MTIDEKIAVMTSYKEGKQIEIKGGVYLDWNNTSTLDFDFINFEYRIKPDEKPFKWNLDNAEILLGKIVKWEGELCTIVDITTVRFRTAKYSFYLDTKCSDLQIKIGNKWILFKDYNPE